MAAGNPPVLDNATLEWMGKCTVFVIVSVTLTFLFTILAPYFGFKPVGEVSSLSQQQTIVQNVFISIVSFLIGASVGTRKKDETISTAITTAATVANTANTQSSPIVATVKTPDVEVPLHAGDVATVKADTPQEKKP